MTFFKAPVFRLRGFLCSFIAFFSVVFSAVLVLNQIQTQTPLIQQKENRRQFQNPSPLTHHKENQVKDPKPPPLIHHNENQAKDQNPPPLTHHKENQVKDPKPPPLIHHKKNQAKDQNPPPLTHQKENQVPIQNHEPSTDQKESQLQNTPSTNKDQKEEKIEIKEPTNGGVTRGDGEEKLECDWSMGQWVYDNVTRPLYRMDQCKFMHDEVACDKYGRKDVKYQNWRWQPNSCDLPRFDGIKFLEKIRGKKLVFVGDSLNRNQWASMACLLESVMTEENKKRIYSNLMTLVIKSYNVTIDFYWSPLLVESNADDTRKHRNPIRIIRPDGFETHTKNYINADIIIFDDYLWWTHHLSDGMKVLYGSFEDPSAPMKNVTMSEGYDLVLKVWSDWLEKHMKNTNKRLFFMTLSPVHYWAEEWGGQKYNTCHNETEPVYKQGYKGKHSEYYLMPKLEKAVANLKTRGVDVQIVNISQMSEYRKDAHPSIYRKFYPNPYFDCTHWCLPGVPDVWNELIYAHIISQNDDNTSLTNLKQNQNEIQNITLTANEKGQEKDNQVQNITLVTNHEEREDKRANITKPLTSEGKKGEEKSECNWSIGQWVYDNVSRPLYRGSQCIYMHEEVDCEKFGRKDLKYQNWRWQPNGCDLPKFDGIRLLEKIRGKRIVFIGDSLNRNQWAAMACLIESVLPEEQKKRVYTHNIMSLIAKSYNATVDFYWSPLLLESNVDDPVNHHIPTRILRAYGLEKHAENYKDADILVFDAHIWWQIPNTTMRILYGSFEDANANIVKVEKIEAYDMALKSWSHWIGNHFNNTNKQIFFMTYSTIHDWAEDWGGKEGRNCRGETEPIYGNIYRSNHSALDYKMAHMAEDVVANLKTKGVKVQIVNISQVSIDRKDAHPVVDRKFYPDPYDDCTHFCVPGVPDVWNELLYTYME